MLERPQELGLHTDRQLADLVQKQRAAVRRLEEARLRFDRAGKRSAHMTKELALEERVDHRRAVDGDKGLLAPRADLVERARHQLLPRARLAAHQNDLGVRGEPLNEAEDLLHGGASSHHAAVLDLARHLAFERHEVGPALELLADLGQHLAEPLEVERLGQVLAGAQLDGFDRAVDGGEAGHQDDFAARHLGADLAQEVETVDVGHAEIDHRQIGRSPHQAAHRVGAARAGHDVEAGLGGQPLEDAQDGQVVVDDKQQRTAESSFMHRCDPRHLATQWTPFGEHRHGHRLPHVVLQHLEHASVQEPYRGRPGILNALPA